MSSDERTGDEAEDAPDDGPAMSGSGAQPGGSETGWNTSQPNPDATDPDSMPSSAKQ